MSLQLTVPCNADPACWRPPTIAWIAACGACGAALCVSVEPHAAHVIIGCTHHHEDAQVVAKTEGRTLYTFPLEHVFTTLARQMGVR